MNHPSARGFTLLEVVLATAMGAMVIVVSLALLSSMERLDRPMARRQQELADLYRARLVIQRSLSSLVMSNTAPPVQPGVRRNAEGAGDQKTQSAFEAEAIARASRAARPPARLILEPDQSSELRARLVDVGLPAEQATSIQRFEVVIDSPPIAPNHRAELSDAVMLELVRSRRAAGASGTSASVAPESSTGEARSVQGALPARASSEQLQAALLSGRTDAQERAQTQPRNRRGGASSGGRLGALRGAFEIRPMMRPSEQRGEQVLYELWWRPMPARSDRPVPPGTAAAAEPEPITDPRQLEAWGEPVLLLSNLLQCRWQLFSTGEKRGSHSAVWERELPAYVEFELKTKSGLYANWMFEVGWSLGPEMPVSDQGSGPVEAVAERGGGDGNAREGAISDGGRSQGGGLDRGGGGRRGPEGPTRSTGGDPSNQTIDRRDLPR